VRHVPVAGLVLDPVREGVSEVERLALVLLVRIARDDAGLEAHAARDDLGQDLGLALADGLALALEQRQELLAVEQRRLEHLAQPRAVLERGEARQHARVGDDGARLVEGAGQVLARRPG
jgi:hypothetical protein